MSVNAEQIEAHYRTSPFVEDVCVIASADGLYGVVVPNLTLMRERQVVNIGDLLRFELEGLSHLLPPHQRLAGYDIWFEPLPRTAAREMDRAEVDRRVRDRQRVRQHDAPLTEADRLWLEEPHAAAVVPLIQARAKRRARVIPDANLEIDLGLDSLDRVELLFELEQRFGTTLADPGAILTVRQLVDGVRGGQPTPATSGDAWPTILGRLRHVDWLVRRRTIAAPLLWVLLRIVRRLLVRVRVDGLDQLPPSGPYIITPNHQSYVDPFILSSVLPYRVFKDLFFVGAIEYFETPLTRWLARTVKLVTIDPDANLVPAMQAGAFGLSRGKIFVVFPEGERSIDGTVKTFKKGAPILARHLGVPIVPVAVKGIYELWPRNRSPNWPLLAPWSGHRVSIHIGGPMMLPVDATSHDSAASLRARVIAMWEAL